jgi:hypothetical protein
MVVPLIDSNQEMDENYDSEEEDDIHKLDPSEN